MRMSELERALLTKIKWHGLPVPAQEVTFHPTRKWRFDFAYLAPIKIAIEVEGGQWITGRHTRGSGFENDAEKYAEAVCHGWFVIRVTRKMIESGDAIYFIQRALEMRGVA